MTNSAIRDKLERDSCLPHGDQLRILLNSEHISYGEVSNLLRSKGVFCYNTDKSFTVPLLSTSLLRPSEFVRLLENSVSREQTPKEKPLQTMTLINPQTDWIAALKDIDLLEPVKKHITKEEIQFENEPELSVINKNKAIIKFKINRIDYSKDLLERDLNFQGEIVITHDSGTLNLSIVTIHTSKETDKINGSLIKEIAKNLADSKMKCNTPTVVRCCDGHSLQTTERGRAGRDTPGAA